jgi:hypothetical protein
MAIRLISPGIFLSNRMWFGLNLPTFGLSDV